VIGMGAQDDFLLAQDFIESTGAVTPTMLWDAGLDTWRAFDVRFNSQMMVASADLSQRTELFFGFGDEQQQSIIDALPDLFG
jgi:hypothetical protein